MTTANPMSRVEAYSDGVFAIAATILVLELAVPSVGVVASTGELWRSLANLWPSYIAFVLSFGSILVMWVSHHHATRLLTGTSTPFLYANGLLLLTIVFLPFPTALLARYVATDLASVAVVLYAGSNALTSIAFMIWFAAMQKPVDLIRPEVGRQWIARIWIQIGSGLLAYLIAAAIGWRWPIIGLGVMTALVGLWITMSIEQESILSPD